MKKVVEKTISKVKKLSNEPRKKFVKLKDKTKEIFKCQDNTPKNDGLDEYRFDC